MTVNHRNRAPDLEFVLYGQLLPNLIIGYIQVVTSFHWQTFFVVAMITSTCRFLVLVLTYSSGLVYLSIPCNPLDWDNHWSHVKSWVVSGAKFTHGTVELPEFVWIIKQIFNEDEPKYVWIKNGEYPDFCMGFPMKNSVTCISCLIFKKSNQLNSG